MTQQLSPQDELIVFEDDHHEAPVETSSAPWKMLVVDDEQQMHKATTFALQGFVFEGKPLEIISAFSGQEAREILKAENDIACILLDVVMETENAGLELVGYIRDEIKNNSVRIILRTGQPGYAPELEVISKYDINDYKAKSELTRTKLITALTSALRSYEQIKAMETGQSGLEYIVKSSRELFQERSISGLSNDVIEPFAFLSKCAPENVLVCGMHNAGDNVDAVVLASGNAIDIEANTRVSDLNDSIAESIQEAFSNESSLLDGNHICLFTKSPSGHKIVISGKTQAELEFVNKKLLAVFGVQIATSLENTYLFEHINEIAFLDNLTRLKNRNGFLTQIQELLDSNSQSHLLLLIDIDNFQAVNDGLGHDTGNSVIKMVAKRLTSTYPNALIGRVSGDTFGVFIAQTSEEDLELIPRQLYKAFETTLRIGDNELPISISAGVAATDNCDDNANELFKNAGIALKYAKSNTKGKHQFFDPAMHEQLKRRLNVIKELKGALENDEMVLFYQPQYCLKTQQYIGVEALVRWFKPDGTIISPMDFIPAAEDSGQIVHIGEWVLKTACEQQVKWISEGLPPLRVAVNISMRQFKDPSFLDFVYQTIQDTGINPKYLELEITESMLSEDAMVFIDQLSMLRLEGITVAIDDFGTGYSSLSYLQRLPVDRVKIDRSFIRRVESNQGDKTIVSLIIKMGHELNLQVIAEGVEDEEQTKVLVELGCDEVQGFFYAKPMHGNDVKELLLKK
ncbi:bifunctional diguanylate cyclase/phosphodiesterase [Litoribrevibacter albus]|uniref:cyclic-guanylate-specific phosphodiesterase n=1 Tax=Litoribrevibacter albus TaxID=1473156 RepID=A0AA37S9D3_9GAMM|nr:EAL domain-containing protein [Litoribrevibacter albus]GLQ30680.1 diguanylate cyclase [Litoribrevibacter albus]